ncbi:hypothetical protein GCM10010429_36100 [Micromonospora olivasterospora]|uniref:Uncharacterized protein n=1 Tax=Micromonospora olivasterospora TaxID=1880 RepID=A0A562IFJ2_MICOL|nr:hypothetical protein JD77_04744 [Micromonospora olivasterospora]
MRRPSGFEVELGVVPVSWADIDPVDPGTRRVVSDGHRVVHDPAGVLAALSAACRTVNEAPAGRGTPGDARW